MQPFGAVEKIKESYQRFVETSLPMQMKKTLTKKFQRLIRDEHLLWQEQYASLYHVHIVLVAHSNNS